MEKLTALEFLEQILEGQQLEPTDIDEIIKLDEGLYLDFKKDEFQSDKEYKTKIRQWVSAFANIEGGLLVLGVPNDKPRSVSGFIQKDKSSIDEWVRSILQQQWGFYSPPPRIQVVKHPQGQVVVIAVAQNPILVPCYESSRLVYYLRFHDATFKAAPDSLVADIQLGRKARPFFNLEFYGKTLSLNSQIQENSSHRFGMIHFVFEMKNEGLVPANNISAGIILWEHVLRDHKFNNHLLSFIDPVEPNFRSDFPQINLSQKTSSWPKSAPVSVPPFSSKEVINFFGDFNLILLGPNFSPTKTFGAVYVVPHNHPPTWFEIRFTCFNDGNKGPKFKDLEVVRMVGERPKISVEVINQNP